MSIYFWAFWENEELNQQEMAVAKKNFEKFPEIQHPLTPRSELFEIAHIAYCTRTCLKYKSRP